MEEKAAVYCRLSQDDGSVGESGSIQTQRTLLIQYCKEQHISIADYYCDDGWSGTNFERPEFQRMLEDIESGKVNTVIVKDLSRFGREYAQMGMYIEHYFEQKNVRFISVDAITLKNKGLKYAAGAPRTHLKNLSGGYYLDSDKPHSLQVCHEFVQNTRCFAAEDPRNGTITRQLATFGLHDETGVRYLMEMEFVLLNGEKHPVSLDVTDAIRVTQGATHKIIHIEVEIELPEVIGNGDGAFDPDLEEWEDIDVAIPM